MATNPHIYVSSVHGTNTGGSDTSFASAQTGAMTSISAASVYDSLESAISGASPGDGDIVYCADNHAATAAQTADVSINSGGAKNGAGLLLVSVDRDNVDQYKPGADESPASDYDYLPEGVVKIAGVSLKTNDTTVDVKAAHLELQDLTLSASSGNFDTPLKMLTDGCSVTCNNVVFDFDGDSNNYFQASNGVRMTMYGGGFTGSSQTPLFDDLGLNGGATLLFDGTDFSVMADTLFNFSTVSNTDNILIRMINCRLHASATLHGTLPHSGARFEMYNTDDSTGGDFHRFEVADGAGSATNNDSTYVTATESWYEGSDKSSIEVITTAMCTRVKPFRFTLPGQYVDLSQAASDVISLDLVTDLTLTDTDIVAYLVYPDGTTSVQANIVTSGKTVGTGNYGIDPLAAGTTLSASSLGASDWTGEPASPNFYKLELDTSGDAGQATAVQVRIEVYKTSIAAGKLFIHPLLTAS